MIKKLTLSLLTLCALWAGLAHPAHALVISDIRVGQHGTTTRLVLEGSADFKPVIKQYDSPPRLEIVMPRSTIKQDLGRVGLPKGVVVKTLKALGSSKQTQLIVYLDHLVRYSPFALRKTSKVGFRYVIDMQRTDKADIAQGELPLKPQPPKPNALQAKHVFTIVLDPGHGGHDTGAIGPDRIYEKNVVLAIGLKLRKLLDADTGVRVLMTRSTDKFIPLADRVHYAQRHNADLFVSIHADSAPSDASQVRGATVYALSEKSSSMVAARLVKNPNQGDWEDGVDMVDEKNDVRSILIDLAQRATLNQSALLARNMILSLQHHGIHMHRTDIRFAGFRVLKGPELPAILVETSYISNRKDEHLLNSSAYQAKLAQAIHDGLIDYLRKHGWAGASPAL